MLLINLNIYWCLVDFQATAMEGVESSLITDYTLKVTN